MRIALAALLVVGLASVIGCGPSAKDFSVAPLDDPAKTVSLADFKGKTVLIDFWATWCGPCKNSMPEIQAVWDKYKSKGFHVLSISNESRDEIFRFHKSSPFTYPVYVDSSFSATNAYHVEGIPQFYLVKDGKILWQQTGFAEGDIKAAVEQAMG